MYRLSTLHNLMFFFTRKQVVECLPVLLFIYFIRGRYALFVRAAVSVFVAQATDATQTVSGVCAVATRTDEETSVLVSGRDRR